jgi:hypothetical protein
MARISWVRKILLSTDFHVRCLFSMLVVAASSIEAIVAIVPCYTRVIFQSLFNAPVAASQTASL